ncbi:MAG: replicative DNA helicase [Mycoplasmataceae bacterium]|nr:replicative DNA helicase [Mycoplasmataceae bacterium]
MAIYKSYENEVSVLGLLITNSRVSQEVIGLLDINDFENEPNKVIFNNIKNLYDENKTIDLVSILTKLNNNGDIKKIGKPEYLSTLVRSAGVASNIETYVAALKEKTKLRDLKSFLDDSKKYLDETDDEVGTIIEKIEEDIFSVTREKGPKREEKISDAVVDYIEKLKSINSDDEPEGIQTGFNDLDGLVQGFRKGDLVILAARPSMGKTAFSLALSANVSVKRHVYYFSLEMPVDQITQRIISANAFIDGKVLKNPNKMGSKDWAKLQQAKPAIERLNLVIDDTPGIKIGEMVWKIRNYAMNNPLDMVVIDYLQLITQSRTTGNRQQDVSDISRTLKLLARELNIPIIVLAQLNRSVESRGKDDKRPLMSDIRESGAIEQDADIIMFLYRDGYYNAEKNTSSQPVEVIISKNRNGATGKAVVTLHMASGNFTS